MEVKSNGSHLFPAKTHGNKYYNQSTELLFYSSNEGNDMIVNVLYCRLHCKMTKHPRKSSVVQHLLLGSISEMHFESNVERQNPVDLNTLKSSSIPSPTVSMLCRIGYPMPGFSLCPSLPNVDNFTRKVETKKVSLFDCEFQSGIPFWQNLIVLRFVQIRVRE